MRRTASSPTTIKKAIRETIGISSSEEEEPGHKRMSKAEKEKLIERLTPGDEGGGQDPRVRAGGLPA